MLVQENRDNFQMLNWLDEFMMGHKGFICGGCFKHIFTKEKVKDLDVFFRKERDWEEAVQYFDSKTPGYSDGERDELPEEDAEYHYLYENDNVKAYIHKKTGIRIELCCRICGTPEEILNQFDFTIVKYAYYKVEIDEETGEDVTLLPAWKKEKLKTHIEYKVLMHDKFFEHLHMKRLVIDDKTPFPMSTFERMFRYARYGYFPCKETKMKIVAALRALTDEQTRVSENLYDGMD